jgi:glucose/arabinose dehydrogenase
VALLRFAFIAGSSAALLLGVAVPAIAATYPEGFSERVIARGLTRPMDVAWAPDGRMFVVQKDGQLRVVNPGDRTSKPLHDISSIVNGRFDRGLLGVAVDADFAVNQYVYLLLTYDIAPPGSGQEESYGPTVSQLRRIRVTAQNEVSESVAILGTQTGAPCPAPANAVDCIPSDGQTHSIGTVRADPDGTLWVGSGDGYSEESTFPVRAYDERSMAGKILHIDRNGNGLPAHPFCPANNNLDDVCTKVHSRGFRNPFRFTLRPGGGLVVGDVGWTLREEVNLVAAQGGGNYGWPCREGRIATPAYTNLCQGLALPTPVVRPVHDYPHGETNSVIGGPTYTGRSYPSRYRNSIFFGDFTGGFMRRLVPKESGGYSSRPFATDWRGLAIGTAPNGDLVSVNPRDFEGGSGTVTRIVYRRPDPDAKGPRLRLRSIRPSRGRISGSASDPSGVRRVEVSVRRRLRRGGCSWWLRGQRQMSTGQRRCDRPRWMKAKQMRGSRAVRWSVRLRGRLPGGSFRILVRASDRRGNLSNLPRRRASLVMVRTR